MKVSRRQFVQSGVALGSAAAIGGGSAPAVAAALAPSGPALATRRVPTATHWGMMHAETEGGRLVRITPAKQDLFPSAMAEALADRVYSPTRVKYPMVRKGYLDKGANSDTSERGKGEFVRVSWERALDLVASELKRVKKRYGPDSIFAGSVDWHSVGKLHNSPVLLRRLLALNGGFLDDSGDFSVQAAMTLLPHIVGGIEVYEQQTAWSTILAHTDLVVLWGVDLLKNNQIGWAPADHFTYGALRELKRKGTKVVSIDPRKTDAAEYLGAEWLAVRPNSDTALMLAIAYTLYQEKLYDQAFLRKYTVGFDRFLPYLLGKDDGTPKTPEWAARITEIPAAAITKIARRMAGGRTMLMGGWALQRQDHGEQPYWMLVTLAAMLGQIGLPGGGFGVGYHYAGGGSLTAKAPGLPGISAPDNSVKVAIPFAHGLNDLLLHPGKTVDFNGEKVTYPKVRMVYWAGGNPLSHQMDRNLQIQAWRKPETIVVNEAFWTSTARFADIVLPVTSTFERNDIEVMSEDTNQYICAMRQAIEPLYEARSDFAIFSALAARLGFEAKYTEGKDELDWIRSFYAEAAKQAKGMQLSMPAFDNFWNGTGVVEFPIPDDAKDFVRHAEFRANPVVNALGTPSGKIEIYSKTIAGFGYADCPGHPVWLEPAEWLGGLTTKRYPLHMVSPHPKYRLHSQLDNTWARRLYEVGGREPMWIHPEDAKARGIRYGDIVRVYNDRGAFLAGAVLTKRMRRNVIAVHEGAWYDPDKPGEVGALCKHGNVNLVTLDKGTSKLARGNVANTVLVDVEKLPGRAPRVTAFTGPIEV